MLMGKCIRVVKYGGAAALFAKTANRIKYKLRARRYMEENFPTEEELAHQRAVVYQSPVLFSVAVPLYNTPEEYLRQMIESLIAQTYPNWELCLADAGDTEDARDVVLSYGDKRIKYIRLEKNCGISGNTNRAVEMARGEYVGLLDHDDALAPNLLFEYRKKADRGADFIYCDEASFTDNIFKPNIIHFKPDYSPYNLRGNNYICHFLMVKKSLFNAVSGLRSGFDGSQDHDLILRLAEAAESIAHIRKPLYYWRIHRNSVAADISAKPYCISAGVMAVSSQLLRLQVQGSVKAVDEYTAVYRCSYKLPQRAGCRTIRRCVSSSLANCEADFIAVVPKGLSLSREQLRRLISLAGLKGVGAAGGIGVYRGKVTDGALRFDGNGCMEIAFDGQSLSGGGYMQRLRYAQNVNALRLFAVIPRSAFESVGGFDETLPEEERLADICLRLRGKGLNIVLDPEIRVKMPVMDFRISGGFAAKHKLRLNTEDEYITNAMADYMQ